MTGKRTAWLSLPKQLRADPELGKAIHEIAEANFRTVQGQILLWICAGVKEEKIRKSGTTWQVVGK